LRLSIHREPLVQRRLLVHVPLAALRRLLLVVEVRLAGLPKTTVGLAIPTIRTYSQSLMLAVTHHQPSQQRQ
jgi:hypothetical protein